MPSFSRPKHGPPSASAPKPPSRGEGLGSDLADGPSERISVPLPPPGDPETWRAELAAQAQDAEEKHQRILSGYLRELAIFLEEERNLGTIIAILKEDLINFEGHLNYDLEVNDQERVPQDWAAIAIVKGLLTKYKAHLASLKKP